MEDRVENAHGPDIQRKSKCLDLKSLYEPTGSEGVPGKKPKRKVAVECGDEKGNKKKSRKEVSLSSFSSVNGNNKRSDDGVLSVAPGDSTGLKSALNQKLKSGSRVDDNVPLHLSDKVIPIPRRKRGLVGRRKLEGGQVSNQTRQSSGEAGLVDQKAKLNGSDTDPGADSGKIKRKKGYLDLKENRKGDRNLAEHLKVEDGDTKHLIEKNGELSVNKSRRKRRKKKDGDFVSKSIAKEAEASAGNYPKKCDGSLEDDEENLEENAARMLSSRFDPSCTGLSSNSKPSAMSPANGSSFLIPSGRDFVSHGSLSVSGSDSASLDTAARALRPRKEMKEKGSRRKRRHFYEVLFGDIDAHWILNHRIKVFWPLDQSWYRGLVNDYDCQRKLHHVKYDDRDEEWINLQNERFKLLLLPTEVPDKARGKKSARRNRIGANVNGKVRPKKEKGKGEIPIDGNGGIGNFTDSEPIISWFARSTNRLKPLPSSALKKQKTSDQSMKSFPQLLAENFSGMPASSSACSLRGDRGEFSRDSEFPERFGDSPKLEKYESENATSAGHSSQPIVYFRKRFRKTGATLLRSFEENEMYKNEPGSSTSHSSTVDEIKSMEEPSLGKLNPHMPLRSSSDVGTRLVLPLIEPRKFKYELCLPASLFFVDWFGAQNCWLFRAVMLLRYGTLMNRWPKISLEMLLVDNAIGLRFLLFEGSLMQALAFVFVVLSTFSSCKSRAKYVELQLPVTSIRFQMTRAGETRKQLVFEFFSFSEVNSSVWTQLYSSVKRYCLLTKRLPVTECTYDNIKSLQGWGNYLPTACLLPSLTRGIQKADMPPVGVIGLGSAAASVKLGHSSHFDEMGRTFLPLLLSFASAPTFFVGLHLKLLMERHVAQISFHDGNSAEHTEKFSKECSVASTESCKITVEEATRDGCFSCAPPDIGPNISECGGAKSTQGHNNGVRNDTYSASLHPEEAGTEDVEHQWQDTNSVMDPSSLSQVPSFEKERSVPGPPSLLNGLSADLTQFNMLEKPVDGSFSPVQESKALSLNKTAGIIPGPNPTGPRSTSHRNRNTSPSFGVFSYQWSDRRADFSQNGFGDGPKRPRTQVSYSVPFRSIDYNSRPSNHYPKGLPHKRFRRTNEKRALDFSRGSQNSESLCCEANVLITLSDRGLRECGARVVLELFDHKEWKLAVKISGSTKYSYKAHQFLQPGSTNRYTHAMMWKGGRDWILEFPDRSQWAIFKEMHEECYNRNFHVASIKNIPIPGVRLIDENGENETEAAFVRSSSKYLRQVETDVEMALNPSNVLYDMDTDDEQWIKQNRSRSEVDSSSLATISDEIFEKIVDTLEKAAYTQQRDQFTSDEIEELMPGVGATDVIKSIYEYWKQKKQRKGMPLIRHLQSPLWERYQQQLTEWESAASKNYSTLLNGSLERGGSIEKPPMFAFCLKPRGLEVQNKGSKQRSNRKFSVSGQSNNAFSFDQDGLQIHGRRSNGFAVGDERILYPGNSMEFFDDSPMAQTSPRLISPRDTESMGYFQSNINDSFPGSYLPRPHRSKQKKLGMSATPNLQTMALNNQRLVSKRKRVNWWGTGGFPEWPGQQYYQPDLAWRYVVEHSDDSDLEEFRLRDASGAAQQAVKTAKLKRLKAQRLLFRADMAIHKAVAALMTAEAIKSSSEDSNGSVQNDERVT